VNRVSRQEAVHPIIYDLYFQIVHLRFPQGSKIKKTQAIGLCIQ
jgi:hypothetical protein